MADEEEKQFEPEFLSRLQCDSVAEGEDARLIARVSGDPKPQIQWFLEGKIVTILENFLKKFFI
jgi:hypothetical protein